MIQDQLVDYINAQTKLGVSRDTIKNTLVSAGWVAGDVEDTLKKVESQNGAASPSAASAATAPMGISTTTTTTSSSVKPASAAGSSASGPQILKVSDLVSGSPATASVSAPAMASSTFKDISPRSPLTGPAASPKTAAPASTTTTTTSTTFTASAPEYAAKPHTSRAAIIVDVILIIILLMVGACAGFLYMQNHALSGQLSALQSQSSGTTSQVSALQSQLAASTTALSAQVSSISTENQELQNELSFYAAPSSTTPATTTPVAVNGLVSGGGKLPYVITAMYGAKISVANSKDASVIAALAPLVGSTTAQQFGGMYLPGSDQITLTVVNGSGIQ